MSAGVLGFLFGLGLGTWVYSKMIRRSNNAKSSLIMASVVGGVAFIIFFTAFHAFVK